MISWDDWVPEDRLRKLTPENRDLANSLRQAMLQAQREARAIPTTTKKNAKGSTRGSEERQTSVAAAAGPRGQKRGRDYEIEKVSTRYRTDLNIDRTFTLFHFLSKSHQSSMPEQSVESSPFRNLLANE